MPRAARTAARNVTPRQRLQKAVGARKRVKVGKSRKGIPQPGHNADEKQERLDFLLQQIAQLRYKSEMKRAFCERFNCSWQVFEDNLTRARTYLRERHEQRVQEIFDESVACLRDVARNGGRDAVAAIAETNRMLGTHAPDKHEHRGEALLPTAVTVNIVTKAQDGAPSAASPSPPAASNGKH